MDGSVDVSRGGWFPSADPWSFRRSVLVSHQSEMWEESLLRGCLLLLLSSGLQVQRWILISLNSLFKKPQNFALVVISQGHAETFPSSPCVKTCTSARTSASQTRLVVSAEDQGGSFPSGRACGRVCTCPLTLAPVFWPWTGGSKRSGRTNLPPFKQKGC